LWPMAAAAQMVKQGLDLYATNLAFMAEEQKIHHELRPQFAKHQSRDARSAHHALSRLFCTGGQKRADRRRYALCRAYGYDCSLSERTEPDRKCYWRNGLNRIFLTGWKSATEDMKDLGINEYLAEINVLVDDLGGQMNLICLCQGGWMSAMYAARFPH
jgi:poly(3-hydroxybutyrate) depolymerase